jgi:hypothetical protein
MGGIPMRAQDSIDVLLHDEETDTELEVTAYFYVCAAEPDVGYMQPYAEWDYTTVRLFGADVIFSVAGPFEDEIVEACNVALAEDRGEYY